MEGIPSKTGAARDEWILSAIREGRAEFEWAPVHSEWNGYTATFYVFRDALKIDGIRILVTADLAQRIADLLDASLLTPKIADLLYQQRGISLQPLTRQPVTSDTATMIAQSKRIDDAIESAGGDDGVSIIQTVGKHWVLVNKIGGTSKAANYGWHFQGSSFGGQKFEPTVSLPGVRLIQGVGTKHNAQHVDYSQNLILMSNDVDLGEDRVRLSDILKDPEYAGLGSHEGVLKVMRQPGVDPPESPDDYTTKYDSPVESSPQGQSDSWLGTVGKALLAGGILAGAFYLAS